jgi:ankyrin repeat protein
MRTLLMTFVLFDVVAFAAGSPELLLAIRNGDHARVQKLLDSGADPNTADADGTTALMHAVVESDVQMMKLLVGKGASVNTKNALNSTALLYAVTDLAKTRVLLDASADVKVTGRRGATPMSVAVTAFGSTPVLKLLTARGAAPEDRLMALAAGNGDLEAIQFLLSIGVGPPPPGGAPG